MRQKVCLVGIALVFIITAFILSAHDAEAVPAFARQTGLSCSTCHFQHFPALNAFGRSFKAGGLHYGGRTELDRRGYAVCAERP